MRIRHLIPFFVIVAIGVGFAPCSLEAQETEEITQPSDAEATAKDAATTDAPTADEAGKVAGEETEDKPARKQGGLRDMALPAMIIGMFLLLYFWMGRGKRKQEAKRKEMLGNLRKGDKVTTIGGIVGTVMEVRESEVTVKVDETGNTRMKFARWSIRGVGDQARTEQPEDKR